MFALHSIQQKRYYVYAEEQLLANCSQVAEAM
jgi:hypothetical protein